MTIERYQVIDDGGGFVHSAYDTLQEARQAADMLRAHICMEYAVIALEYTYSDTELVYTTNDADVWSS